MTGLVVSIAIGAFVAGLFCMLMWLLDEDKRRDDD